MLCLYTHNIKKCACPERVSCKVKIVTDDLIDYYKLRIDKIKCKKR